jgi:streptogramin lyase
LSVSLTFDGHRCWTANIAGSVSIVSFSPFSVTNVTTGFANPYGIIFDGSNIWVTDSGDDKVKKLDQSGNILLSVSVGNGPRFPAFDGENLWVPCIGANAIYVIRATGGLSGTVLAVLNGNGVFSPQQAAFDGTRILATNLNNSVSLWNATDLAPIGTLPIGDGSGPFAVCSDGLNFWITLQSDSAIARF